MVRPLPARAKALIGIKAALLEVVLIPRETPGITVRRILPVLGADDAPHGHAEISFEGVRVPAENILAGEGRADLAALESLLGRTIRIHSESDRPTDHCQIAPA